MIRDVGGVGLSVTSRERLHRVGHAQVEALATRRREECEQGLADLLVNEGVARLAVGGDVLDQGGADGLLQRVEKAILVHALEAGEEVEAKGLAGERRDREDAAAVVANALETLPDHQADAA